MVQVGEKCSIQLIVYCPGRHITQHASGEYMAWILLEQTPVHSGQSRFQEWILTMSYSPAILVDDITLWISTNLK